LCGFETIALSKPLALFAHREQYSVATLRNGMKLLVCGKDHVGRIILYMGDFEPRITRIAEALLREGDCVLDIGSNVGWFTMIAANLVRETGVVHAFDPQRELNTFLRASLNMNDLKNVHIHEVALSDESGPARLYSLKGNSGLAQLAPASGDLWSESGIEKVEAASYLEGLDLPPIRLLKIDVEGHEEVILKSAGNVFDKNPPEVIIFESAGEAPLADRPLGKLLSSRGYKLFSLPTSILKLRLVDAEKHAAVKTIDHIALFDGPNLKRDLTSLGALNAQGTEAA
jgi:FkbM family methyltransferase